MSLAAYKKTIRESESPRQIERRILSRVTSDLTLTGEGFDASETSEGRLSILAAGLRDSLYENQRFWAALRYDLCRTGKCAAGYPEGIVDLPCALGRPRDLCA